MLEHSNITSKIACFYAFYNPFPKILSIWTRRDVVSCGMQAFPGADV